MLFPEYLKDLRKKCGLRQNELAMKSGISAAEISRIESGERQKPSPLVLRALAPYLCVPYDELLYHAGYTQEIVDHPGYRENIYRDDQGKLVDIIHEAKDMFERNHEWASLAFRVSSSSLTKDELDIIRIQTQTLLDQFLKYKRKHPDKHPLDK